MALFVPQHGANATRGCRPDRASAVRALARPAAIVEGLISPMPGARVDTRVWRVISTSLYLTILQMRSTRTSERQAPLPSMLILMPAPISCCPRMRTSNAARRSRASVARSGAETHRQGMGACQADPYCLRPPIKVNGDLLRRGPPF
jgi:hypothetical protein